MRRFKAKMWVQRCWDQFSFLFPPLPPTSVLKDVVPGIELVLGMVNCMLVQRSGWVKRDSYILLHENEYVNADLQLVLAHGNKDANADVELRNTTLTFASALDSAIGLLPL